MDHILVVDTEYVYRNMGWIKYSIGLAIVGLIVVGAWPLLGRVF